MSDFVKVASLNDIPTGEMLIVDIEGEEVVIANVEGEIHAFGSECTHRGGPLGEGILDGHTVECPWHQGRFDVKTGDAVDEPPTEAVATFQVQVDGDDIKVAKG